MNFKEEVQEYFRKAGWYEGRDLRVKYDVLPRFNELPEFLKEFLYEYGDLEVETHKYNPEDVTGVLNLKVLLSGAFSIEDSLDNLNLYGGMKTFSFGAYHLDNASLMCDEVGSVYMISDAPTMMADNFIEGIEKVIMEDYSNTKEWHFDVKEWKSELY